MSRTPNSRTTFAGGFPIAIGFTAGAILGATQGNALLWLAGGGLAGIGVATLIWLVDRRR